MVTAYHRAFSVQNLLCGHWYNELYFLSQIRMMDGSPLTQKFGAHESLGAVRLFAQLNRKDGDTSPFG